MKDNFIIHKAETRGSADLGWLQSRHTFSFGNYYDAERMSFGVLRVLNDDIVAPGKGFGTHPHHNMEIISIPLSGDLQHADSTGRNEIIKQGDIQVMSAGTGIEHSEMNANPNKEVQFLQIWIIPRVKDVQPRYEQATMNPEDYQGKFGRIVSPTKHSIGVWVHQETWFYLGVFDKPLETSYQIKKKGNGVYVFIIEGGIRVEDFQLHKRDAIGIVDKSLMHFQIEANSTILLMEVPME
ncbi:pirin family protein [uncultured Croceitalea sp.]|uniref:pirin family protein n=1 Tax=uncultured Croceitalea sp. TaxID=1798908 RepID=UPI00330614F4